MSQPNAIVRIPAKFVPQVESFYLALAWFTHNKWKWHELPEHERNETLALIKPIQEDWEKVLELRKKEGRREKTEPAFAAEIAEVIKQLSTLVMKREERFYEFRELRKELLKAYEKRVNDKEAADAIRARRDE